MKIFLSYSSSDRKTAEELAKQLTDRGVSVWMADPELPPGANSPLQIGRAVAKADAMSVIASPDAMRSDEVRREIDYALTSPRFKNRFFPVKAQETRDAPWILRELNMIDLRHKGLPGTATAIT